MFNKNNVQIFSMQANPGDRKIIILFVQYCMVNPANTQFWPPFLCGGLLGSQDYIFSFWENTFVVSHTITTFSSRLHTQHLANKKNCTTNPLLLYSIDDNTYIYEISKIYFPKLGSGDLIGVNRLGWALPCSLYHPPVMDKHHFFSWCHRNVHQFF